ncbi:hypothetical protein GCM10017781_21500 [Deinococcus metalli]|nr:hypothetical protein GCM10017781_21500 [Deinococcus metalli]
MNPLALCIAGFWQGEPSQPRRRFQGEVLTSSHTRIRAGEVVSVTFCCPQQRVMPCSEHGAYILKVQRTSFPLISFLCADITSPGPACRQDTALATWFALTTPEPATTRTGRRASSRPREQR